MRNAKPKVKSGARKPAAPSAAAVSHSPAGSWVGSATGLGGTRARQAAFVLVLWCPAAPGEMRGRPWPSWALPAAQQEPLAPAAESLDLLFVRALKVEGAVKAPSRADLRKRAGRSKLLSQEQFM